MQLEKLWSANGTKTQQSTVERTVFVAMPMGEGVGGISRGEGAVAVLVVWGQGKEFCWLLRKNLMVCGVLRLFA